MRGRRRTVASALAEVLAARPGSGDAALAVALKEAAGPRLAREFSVRGVTQEGRCLVVVASAEWATQLRAVEGELCRKAGERLGRSLAAGLEIFVEGRARR
jgi:hypothetical protein